MITVHVGPPKSAESRTAVVQGAQWKVSLEGGVIRLLFGIMTPIKQLFMF